MIYNQPPVDPYINQVIVIVEKQKEPEKKEPKLYTIKSGDNLTKIAEAHTTSVERLWAANPELTSPDLIEPEKPLKIPENDEVLPERPLPATVEVQKVGVSQGASTRGVHGSLSVSGNNTWKFPYGFCTYYASQQRPDLHVRGNAADWIKWSNGTVPRIGAVAVNTWAAGGYGHVGIVTAIDGNRVQVTHMNYKGFGVVSTDWTEASYWAGYIY